MRRSLLALLLSAGVCLVLSASAFSTGPGGWNHMGERAPGSMATSPPFIASEPALPRRELHQRRRDRSADRIAKWDGVSWHGARRDADRQRIGLRDRALRRQDLRGRQLRQRRWQGAPTTSPSSTASSWKPFCNATRESRLQRAGAPGLRAPGRRVQALRRRHLPERQRRHACRLPDRLRPRHRARRRPTVDTRRRLHRSHLRPWRLRATERSMRRPFHEPRSA